MADVLPIRRKNPIPSINQNSQSFQRHEHNDPNIIYFNAICKLVCKFFHGGVGMGVGAAKVFLDRKQESQVKAGKYQRMRYNNLCFFNICEWVIKQYIIRVE